MVCMTGSSTFAIWPVYQRDPSLGNCLPLAGVGQSSRRPRSTCGSCRWITLATRARAQPENGALIVLGRVLQQAARAGRQLRGRSSLSMHSIISEKSAPSEGRTHINETSSRYGLKREGREVRPITTTSEIEPLNISIISKNYVIQKPGVRYPKCAPVWPRWSSKA